MQKRILTTARLTALSLFLLAGTACQEQQGLPLGGQAGDATVFAARLLFADPCQDVAGRSSTLRDLVRAVNAERAKAKVSPLRINETLSSTADYYACRLIDGEFFGHVDPFNGSTVDSRASNFGYAFLKVGENLAAGQESVDQVISEWINSPGHRANMLDPAYTEIGVAVKVGGRMGKVWVQEFGRPITAGEEPRAAVMDDVPKGSAASQASGE